MRLALLLDSPHEESVVNRWLPVLLALAFAVGLTGCGNQPPRSAAGTPRPAVRDADQAAAAALNAWSVARDSSQALRLIERASDLAPDRPDLVWLYARLCSEAPGCEPEPLEARLRKLDPGNAVVWMSALSAAEANGDTQAQTQILDAISRAQRFDLYWNTLLWRLSAASAGTAEASRTSSAETQNGVNPLASAMDETANRLAAILVPALQPLSAACARERVRDAEATARCERIAQVLQRGDTFVAEGLGLGIAQRLATPGSTQAALVHERIAILRHQNQAAGAIREAQVERDKFSLELIELMKQLRREQDVSVAVLRWAGQPVTP